MMRTLYYYIKRRRKKLLHGTFFILFLLITIAILKKHQKLITTKYNENENTTETCTALFVVLHFRIIDKEHSPVKITEGVIKNVKSKLESYTNTSDPFMFVDHNISDNGLPQSMQDSAYYIQGPNDNGGKCGYVWGFDSNNIEIRYNTCSETNLKNSWKFCKLDVHLFDEDTTKKTSAFYDEHCIPNLAASWPLQSINKCTKSNGQDDMTLWTKYARNLDKNLLSNVVSEYIGHSISAWQVLGLVVEYDKELLHTSFSVLSSPKTSEDLTISKDTTEVLKITVESRLKSTAVAETTFIPNTKSSLNLETHELISRLPRHITTLPYIDSQDKPQETTQQSMGHTSLTSPQLQNTLTQIHPTPNDFGLPKNTASIQSLSSTSEENSVSRTPLSTFTSLSTDMTLFTSTLEIHSFAPEAEKIVFNEQIYNEMIRKLYPELFSQTQPTTHATENYEGSGMILLDDVQDEAIGSKVNTEIPQNNPTTDLKNDFFANEDNVPTTPKVNKMVDLIALRDLVHKIYGVVLNDLPVPLDTLLSQIHNATDHTHEDISNIETKNQFPDDDSLNPDTTQKEKPENISPIVNNTNKTSVQAEMVTTLSNSLAQMKVNDSSKENELSTSSVTLKMPRVEKTTTSKIKTHKGTTDTVTNILPDDSSTSSVNDTHEQISETSTKSNYAMADTNFTTQTTQLTKEPGTLKTSTSANIYDETIQTSLLTSNTDTKIYPVILPTTDVNLAILGVETDTEVEDKTTEVEDKTNEQTQSPDPSTGHEIGISQLAVPTTLSYDAFTITYPDTISKPTFTNLDDKSQYTDKLTQAPLPNTNLDQNKNDKTTPNFAEAPAKFVPSSLDIDIPPYSASHEEVTATTLSNIYTSYSDYTATSVTSIKHKDDLVSNSINADMEASFLASTIQNLVASNDFSTETLPSTFKDTTSPAHSESHSHKSPSETLKESTTLSESVDMESSSQIMDTYSIAATNIGITFTPGYTESGSGLNGSKTSNAATSDTIQENNDTSLISSTQYFEGSTSNEGPGTALISSTLYFEDIISIANHTTISLSTISPVNKSSITILDHHATSIPITLSDKGNTAPKDQEPISTTTQDADSTTLGSVPVLTTQNEKTAPAIQDAASTLTIDNTTIENSNATPNPKIPNDEDNTTIENGDATSIPTTFNDEDNTTIEDGDATSIPTTLNDEDNTTIEDGDSTSIWTTLNDEGSTGLKDIDASSISTTLNDKGSTGIKDGDATTISTTLNDEGSTGIKDGDTTGIKDGDATTISTTLNDEGSTGIKDGDTTSIPTTLNDEDNTTIGDGDATSILTTLNDEGSTGLKDGDASSISTTLNDEGSTTVEDGYTTLNDEGSTGIKDGDATTISTTLNDEGSTGIKDGDTTSISTTLNDEGSTGIKDGDATSISTTKNDEGSTSIEYGNATSISTTKNDEGSTTIESDDAPQISTTFNDEDRTTNKYHVVISISTILNDEGSTTSIEDGAISTTLNYDEDSTTIEYHVPTSIPSILNDKSNTSIVNHAISSTQEDQNGVTLHSLNLTTHESMGDTTISTSLYDEASTTVETTFAAFLSTTLHDNAFFASDSTFTPKTPEDKSVTSIASNPATFISTIPTDEDSSKSTANHDTTSVFTTANQNDNIVKPDAISMTTTLEDMPSSTAQIYSISIPTDSFIFSSTPDTTSDTQISTLPSATIPTIDVTSTTVGKWFEYSLPPTWKLLLKESKASITVSLSTVNNIQNRENQLVEDRWLRYHRDFDIICGVPIGKNGTEVSQISTFIIQMTSETNILAQVTLHVSLYPPISEAIPDYEIVLHMNTKASSNDEFTGNFDDKSPAAFLQKLTLYLQETDPLLRHSSINLLQFNYIHNTRKKRSLVSSITASWNIDNTTINYFNSTFSASLIDPIRGDVDYNFFLSMLPQFIINRINLKSTPSHQIGRNNSPQQNVEETGNVLHTIMPPILIVIFIVILFVVLFKFCKKKAAMYYVPDRFQNRTFGPNRKPIYLDEEIEMNYLRPRNARIMQEDIMNDNQTSFNYPMEMNIDRTRAGPGISRAGTMSQSSKSSDENSEDGYYSFTHGSFYMVDE